MELLFKVMHLFHFRYVICCLLQKKVILKIFSLQLKQQCEFLQLTLLPIGIHITFSYTWKIWFFYHNLGIKLFCPWGINLDIHPVFLSLLGPISWGITKKSMAPVNLNSTLWEIGAARVHSGIVPQLPRVLAGWDSALCATHPTALCWGRLL